MFRHVVMFRWTEEASAADRVAAVDALRAFAEQITDLGTLRVGSDAGLAEGNFDAVVVVDFAGPEQYLEYTTDPRHVELLTRRILPFLAARAAVQTELT